MTKLEINMNNSDSKKEGNNEKDSEIEDNENENCKKEEDEEVKRDQLIYDIFIRRSQSEYERTRHLESKATTIVGFVGIIFSLVSPTGINLLDKVKDSDSLLLSILLYVFGLFFLVSTLYCALICLYIKKWNAIPNAEYFMDNYVINNKNRSNILAKLSMELCHSIKESEKNNESKAQYLKFSILLFATGILASTLFIISIIIQLY